MLKILTRTLFGLLVGYAVYALLVGVLIGIEQSGGGFSRANNFFVWLYPLGSPFLLNPQEWRSVPLEENLLTLSGGMLLLAGTAWANWAKKPK
jgi:hypothetical protein